MKLQKALKSIALIAILLASALVSYSDEASTRRGRDSASEPSLNEIQMKDTELASKGVEVGKARA